VWLAGGPFNYRLFFSFADTGTILACATKPGIAWAAEASVSRTAESVVAWTAESGVGWTAEASVSRAAESVVARTSETGISMAIAGVYLPCNTRSR